MDGTILGQGTFTQGATAVNQNIIIPSGVDFLDIYNYTQASGTSGYGFRYYWQRGMPTTGIYYASGAAGAVSVGVTAANAFRLYDPSGQTAGAIPLFGNAVATTASTNATRPVVSTADTTGISVGTIVRLSGTAQTDVNGIDMVVGAVVANTSFTLLTANSALATAPGAIGGAGFYRIVNYFPLFYPRRLYVTNVTRATNAQVSTTIAHGFVPGQSIRFSIPTVSAMVQLNGQIATVASVVDDYTFTINVDTTAYTAFTWPTIAQQPSSFPMVTPVGEDTAYALASTASQTPTIGGLQIYNSNTGILSDSTVNTGYLGMTLAAGDLLPAGRASDVVYWRAGKSTYGGL